MTKRAKDQMVEAFSAPIELLDAAKERAAALGMNKSGFFRYCLAKELGFSEADALDYADHRSVAKLRASMRPAETVRPARPAAYQHNHNTSKPWVMNDASSDVVSDAIAISNAAEAEGLHLDPSLQPTPEVAAPTAHKVRPSSDAAKRSKARPSPPKPAPK